MEGGRASTVLPQGELCLLRYTRRRPSPPLRGTMGCRYLNQKSELTGRLFPCRPRNESGRHRRPTARPAALRRRCRLRRRSARRPGEARARGEGRSPTSPPSLPRRAHGPGSRAGGGRRDPRPAGAAPGPLVAAPGRPRAPGEPTGRRGVRGRGAEEEEGLCRRVGAPAAPQWHRRPPCRWAESLGGGRRRRQGRPGAGREPSGAGEAWRGGAGRRRRRRGAGVDPAAGPGHGGGAGGRPRRPGGERHVGGVRPAVGRRDGHPGEWGRGGIGLGGSLPWDGAGRGAPLPSTAPPAPPPGGGRRSPGRAGGSPRHLLRRLPQRASVPAVRARTSQREWFRGRNPVSYRISATAFVWASAESFVGCQCRRDASPARSPAGEPGLGSGLLTGPERSGPRVCLHAQKRLLRLINGRIVSCCSGTLADAVTFGRKAGVLLPLHSTHVFSASRRQARVKPRVPRGRAARPAALPGCRSWSSYSRRFFGSELLGYGPRSFCAGDLLRRD